MAIFGSRIHEEDVPVAWFAASESPATFTSYPSPSFVQVVWSPVFFDRSRKKIFGFLLFHMTTSGCFQHTVDTAHKRLMCIVDLGSDDIYFSEYVAKLRGSFAPAVNNKKYGGIVHIFVAKRINH